MARVLLALVAVLVAMPVAAQSPVPIYVGPQARDGFVDVDQGVLDSIHDVQAELRKRPAFRVLETAAGATLHLTIVSRTTGQTSGPAIGIAGGAVASIVPLGAKVLTATLKAGAYDKTFTVTDNEGHLWRWCAESLTKDVDVWLTANRGQLAR